MDTTTKNARVVAIHLARVCAHLKEAHRELNRIDPSVFTTDTLKAVSQVTAMAWLDAVALAKVPVITEPKKSKKSPEA